MKEFLKKILKAAGVYHPLQGFYRQQLFKTAHKKTRKEFEKYRGPGFQCNVCRASYKMFAPRFPSAEDKDAIDKNNVIAGYGENVFCPRCMSTARERLVIAMLGKINITGKRILHFSPEEKVYHYLSEKTAIITADLKPGFYKKIDSKALKEDLTKLSFADNSFDMVIANHVLEHIPDDRKAMKEICRVLKSPGTAILQVPFSTTVPATVEEPGINNPRKQSELFGQKDHVRIYNRDEYITRLREAGFYVEYIPHASLIDLYSFAIQPGEGFFQIRK
jgi:SAM-dependent methyltransferase